MTHLSYVVNTIIVINDLAMQGAGASADIEFIEFSQNISPSSSGGLICCMLMYKY